MKCTRQRNGMAMKLCRRSGVPLQKKEYKYDKDRFYVLGTFILSLQIKLYECL